MHAAEVMPWQGAGEADPGRVRWETRLEERAPAPHKGLEGSHLTGP